MQFLSFFFSFFFAVALQRFGEEDLPGQLHLLKDLDQEQQCALKLSPPSQFQLRTGAARDWPDARAVWSVTVRVEKNKQTNVF